MTTEFGSLLRAWRDRTRPASVGVVETTRRAPGLRREELAGLAGISVDYLVQLERGRASRPSAQVLGALCRALRLPDDEAALLHRSVGYAFTEAAVDHEVPAGVERLLHRLDDWPVALYSADWWLLRWNPLWAALLGDPAALLGRSRNLVWHEFTDVPSRVVLDGAGRAAFRSALVADLRVASLEHPHDPGLRRLVEDLRTRSTEFDAIWRTGRVARHRSARKLIDHPQAGRLTLDSDVLQAPGSDVHIITYSAEPGSDEAARLDLLGVLGNEAFAH
ncbi:helix-turn-helix domain-containing protein [Actinoplanes sp. N902-109]|uniref:helix-turn-helix domain-containing protein n=1 Tax=Actinoplanes sp. (strain N902-109) TaxID=649831 RepID=UPI0003293A40|nr:helix-turn-helix transcriptional regulator [Actinoplanes sp. N902-109]AGL17418.1 putative HTH-type transcriptional regulator [Actinoplanes sp. N902-109]